MARDIVATTGNPRVGVRTLDLADRASVAAFLAAWDGPLHILVNNAGIMASPERRLSHGWELQFATNHLGHFQLATGLHGALTAVGDARVVSVSSAGHQRSPVVFDDINFERRPYDPFLAYGQSKTANALFAVEASRRWAADGIAVNAVMPGATRTPGVANLEITPERREQLEATRADAPDVLWKTPEQGAATPVLLAASPLLAGVSGRYFEDGQEAQPHVPGGRSGVVAWALDPDAAFRLWEISTDAFRV